MAFKCVEREWCATAKEYRHEFVLDSAADLETLPDCCPGSVAVVADKDGPVYMLNASREWREL